MNKGISQCNTVAGFRGRRTQSQLHNFSPDECQFFYFSSPMTSVGHCKTSSGTTWCWLPCEEGIITITMIHGVPLSGALPFSGLCHSFDSRLRLVKSSEGGRSASNSRIHVCLGRPTSHFHLLGGPDILTKSLRALSCLRREVLKHSQSMPCAWKCRVRGTYVGRKVPLLKASSSS